MRRMSVAIVGILMLMIAGASACHWFCCPTEENKDGNTGIVPSAGGADREVEDGAWLTYTASETTGKTYSWVIKNDYGEIKAQSTTGSITYQFTGCDKGYSVIYTVSGTTDGCVVCKCDKIFVKCLPCPSISNWCVGHEPTTQPSMPDSSTYTYKWYMKESTADWGASISEGTTTPGIDYTTVAPGNYDMKVELWVNGVLYKTCQVMSFYVEAMPTGDWTVS